MKRRTKKFEGRHSKESLSLAFYTEIKNFKKKSSVGKFFKAKKVKFYIYLIEGTNEEVM